MSKQNEPINDKIARLQELTDWFESEDFRIEEATDKYKAAAALAREIEQDLAEFKNEIVVLKQKFDQE